MRIFLSYPHEYGAEADTVAVRLRAAGHAVFFGPDQLSPAGGYDEKIRRSIKKSHLLIFLLGPEFFQPGRFTLSELSITRERWPSPVHHVLPVLLRPMQERELGGYLAAVSVLKPTGDIAADIIGAVCKIRDRRRRAALLKACAAVVIATVTGLIIAASLKAPSRNERALQTIGPASATGNAAVPEARYHPLFLSEGADSFIPMWNPRPRKGADGAMTLEGPNLFRWSGAPLGRVHTLAFWVELNADQGEVAWSTAQYPSPNAMTRLKLPSSKFESGNKEGKYTLIPPHGVELLTSPWFDYDRPIPDEKLTVLVSAKPETSQCALEYIFAFDGPSDGGDPNNPIVRDLFSNPEKKTGCITNSGNASQEVCSGAASVSFLPPINSTLRLLKVTVNDKDPIGSRCTGQP